MSTVKNIAILGSTGSIGRQTLEVAAAQKEKIKVSVLTANSSSDLLIAQAKEFLPSVVVIIDEKEYQKVKSSLSGLPIEVQCGNEALEAVTALPQVDLVLTALVGFAGLKPTVNALRHGKHIALANKETLVVAGEIVTQLAKENNCVLLPVDSEHSALFQCLVGEPLSSIEKIYLTASGGPFRGFTKAQLEKVTVEQALKHPNWSMGAKITIDSASMMNKGLEVIEAKWLFELANSQIDIIVHPQSIIHSVVQFNDGSMKAQMGLPDMRLPIQYALDWPNRQPNSFPRFNFTNPGNLSFEQVDRSVFRCIDLAFIAMEKGGNLPCILNAANEETVKLFLNGTIPFTGIAELNERAMEKVPFLPHPGLEDLFGTDLAARRWITENVASLHSKT